MLGGRGDRKDGLGLAILGDANELSVLDVKTRP